MRPTEMTVPGNDRRVLLLSESDAGQLALAVVRCLQVAGGYEVHCLSGVADSILRRSAHCRVQHVSWSTPDEMLAAVAEYVRREPVDLILPIEETLTVTAGSLAQQFEPFAPLAPAPDPVLCRTVDDKWTFHQLMSDAGLPVPRAALATADGASIPDDLDRWGTPLLLKPTLQRGGTGIRSFEQAGELLDALDALPPGAPGEFLIEEFIPGENASCGLLCVDGKIIASTVYRSRLRQAHAFTSAGLGLEFIRDERLVAVAAGFAEVTHWTGVVNLDLRIDSRTGEPVLIEANPRYWQTVLGSLAMGVNFPDLHCRLALGAPFAVPKSRTGLYLDTHSLLVSPSNVVALITRHPGFLRHIDRRLMSADPRVDAELAYRALRRSLGKLASRVKKAIPRPWRRPPGA